MFINNVPSLEIASQRVDLFISYSQNSLPNKNIPATDLISAFRRALDDCFNTVSGKPSVFYRGGNNGNNDRVEKNADMSSEGEDVVRAVMQLRGGGFALCILSDEYFKDKTCIAELSTLFFIQQEDPDITFIFCTPSSKFLQENQIAIALFPDLRFSVASTLSPDQQPAEAVNWLVSLVCNAWSANQYAIPPRPRLYCLGQHTLQSFLCLKSVFGEASPLHLAKFLKIDYFGSCPSTISAVLDHALHQRIITLKDLSRLKEYSLQLSSEALESAIEEYERKWITATKFDWSEHKFRHLFRYFCKPPETFESNYIQKPSWMAVAEEIPKEVFYIPNNPPYVHCDFETADMPEAKLKSMVLSDDLKSRASDSVESLDSTKSTTVIGMMGSGKTCALLALGHLRETRRRFHGGIAYMFVGQDAGLLKLVACIANSVEVTGGVKKARDIRRNKSDYKYAINTASKWFQHQPYLFLIDDVWAVRGITSHVVDKLSELAKNPQSRIVLTTRDVRVCSGNVLQFPKLGSRSRHASRILSFSAMQNAPPFEPSAYTAFSQILDACNGLRLSLAICGNAVYKLKSGCAVDQCAWNKFADSLQPCLSIKNHLFRIATQNVGKALALAQEQEPNFDWEGIAKHFCIAKKNHTIPISVFQRLWNKDKHETERLLQYFERFSFVQIVINFVSGGTQVGVLVHDDILEYSRKLSSQKERRFICWRLVRSYTSSFSDMRTKSFLPRPISHLRSFVKLQRSSFADKILNTADDGYISEHICYLLGEAGLLKELLSLFLTPEWVISQIELKGASQIEKDVAIATRKIIQDETFSRTELNNVEQFLCALKDASFLSLYELGENWKEELLWSQLHSRLQWLRKNLYGEVFLKCIEECCPQVLERPTEELLPPAGCSLKHSIRIQGRILCSQVVKNLVFVAFIENEALFTICYNCDHVTAKGSMSVPCQGNVKDIEVAQFSPTCESLALGFKGGSIEVWIGIWLDLFSSLRIPSVTTVEELMQNNDQCWSISGASPRHSFSSRTGKRTTTSSISKVGPATMLKNIVEVPKNFEGGCTSKAQREEIFMETRKRDLYFVKLEGHTGAVSSVCISLDGTLVVSGSKDNTVRMWKRSKVGWSLDEKLLFQNGHIHVDVSRDGKRVVTGSADKGLLAWELQNGNWTCVASAKNDLIDNNVCISQDGVWIGFTSAGRVSIRKWPENLAETDLKGSEFRTSLWNDSSWSVMRYAIDNTLSISGVLSDEISRVMPDTEIYNMRMCNGRNKIAVAFRSGELILWELSGGSYVKRVLVNRDVSEPVVESLGPDGRVLSRHGDGTVNVWEMTRGKWEVEPYHEYHEHVLGNQLSKKFSESRMDLSVWESQILSKFVSSKKMQQKSSGIWGVLKQKCAPSVLHRALSLGKS